MKKAIRLILVFDGAVMFASAMLVPIYAVYVEGIGGDLLTASSAWTIFMLVTGVVLLGIGRLEDKLDRPKIFSAIGYLIIGIGTLGYLLVKSPSILFVVQAVIGLGTAIAAPATTAIYSMNVDEKKRATQWGDWEGIYYIVTAVGAFLGGLIANRYGFDALFITMSSICLLSACVFFILPRKYFRSELYMK